MDIPVYFTLFGLFSINRTIVMTWIVMAIILAFAIAVNVSVRRAEAAGDYSPKGFVNWGELLLEGVGGIVREMLGETGVSYIPFITTLTLFILVANLLGTIPLLESPTGDLNTTAALGLMVFLVVHYTSIKTKGIVNYIKGYFEPFWVLFPLNMIGEIAKPLSHSFRLYGNMTGGAILIGVVYMLAPWLVPVPLLGWFNIFSGVIQTAVFVMLAIAYIQIGM